MPDYKDLLSSSQTKSTQTYNQEASSSADLQEHGDEQDRQGEAEDTLRGREDPEASCLASEPRISLGSPP